MILQFAVPVEHGIELLRMAMDKLSLSARAYNRLLKVARTIADLAGSVQIAEDYPVEEKLVPGLDATAYMSADELADVKTQMDLLDWDETFVQACFAKSDDEVKTIFESFFDLVNAAGIDRFEKYVKDLYEEDPDSVSFYD